MKFQFSFKSEPNWIVAFSLAPVILGILAFFVIWVVTHWR